MKKLAIIRDNNGSICPFGLTIPFACKIAGGSVDDMESIDKMPVDTTKEQIEEIRKKNIEILKTTSPKGRCKYAAKIFASNHRAVDCDYGDSAAGLSQENAFTGSNYSTKNLFPTSIDGLYGYPMSAEYDLGISRNQQYGIQEWANNRMNKLNKRSKLWEKLKK